MRSSQRDAEVSVLSLFVFLVRHQTYERAIIAVALTMCMTVLGQAQGIPYRIQFVDKGPVAFVPGSPLYDSVLRTFSPRALARRAMIGTTPLLDSLDAPIYAPYVDAVR